MTAVKVVTLYTKPGCHLCEAVEQVIRRVRRRMAFELVVRDILEDATDFERYALDIPVVTVDGREVARHRLDAGVLEAALEAA